MKKLISILFLIIFVFTCNAQAFWIWSPRTGKWTNPKSPPKENPKEELNFGLDLMKSKNYEKAINAFRTLIRYFPKAFEAAEAQFYIGKCYEALLKDFEAYKAYQLVLDKYPFNKRSEEILQIQYDIAERFISGVNKTKVLGMTFQLEDPAIEILQKIIENAPYSKLAPKAQYRLGVYLKAKSQFYEARAELEKVIEKYPDSEWAEPARFQLAETVASISPKPSYDQNLTQEAREKFEEFAKTHPEATLSQAANIQVEALKNKEAESNFIIAKFYEKQNNFASAKIYYQYILDNFPESSFAPQAVAQLKVVEEKEKKVKKK